MFSLALRVFAAFSSLLVAFASQDIFSGTALRNFVLFYSIVNLASVFYRFGSESVFVKYLNLKSFSLNDRWLLTKTLNLIKLMSLLGGLLGLLMYFLTFDYIYIFIVFASFLFSVVYIFGQFFFMKGRKVVSVVLMNLSLPISIVLGFAVFLGFEESEIYFYSTILFSLLINMIVSGVLIKKTLGSICLGPSVDVRRDIKKIERSAFVSSFSQQVIGWGSPMIAALYVADDELGVYFVLQRLAFSLGFILVLGNFYILPKLSSIFIYEGVESVFEHMKKYNSICFYFGSVIAFSLILVLFFYGDIFFSWNREYILVVSLLLLSSQIFNLLSGSSANFLNISGYPVYVMWIVFTSAMIGLVLSLILCGYYAWGSMGLAVSVFISVVILNVMQTMVIYMKTGYLYTSILVVPARDV